MSQDHEITPPTPLQRALMDVCKAAWAGASPAVCAVVYRSLAREYPNATWLTKHAVEWEALGERWDGSSVDENTPKRGNLAPLIAKTVISQPTFKFTDDDVAEAERQLERAKAAGWL